MSDKRTFRLVHAEARRRAVEAVKEAPEGYAVTVSPPTRSLEQNALLWPLLQAFADQLQWPVNGQMVWMTPDEWKDVLTAAFRQENPRLAMGLVGNVVMLGSRTSKFGVREMSEFIDFITATGIARDVDFNYREQA